jgi:hypothetical protein
VRLNVAAFVWSVGLIVAGLVLPVYDGQTVSNSNGLTLTTATLVQHNGIRVLVALVIPALGSVAVALAMARRHTLDPRWSGPVAWLAVAVVAVEAGVAMLSIGVFILPVAILLAVAVSLVPRAGAMAASAAGTQ